MPGMIMDLFKHDCLSKPSRILLETQSSGMLKDKEYQALEILVPVVFAYDDIWTGFLEHVLLAKIHVHYKNWKKGYILEIKKGLKFLVAKLKISLNCNCWPKLSIPQICEVNDILRYCIGMYRLNK